MKKIFIVLVLAALLPWGVQAQDARQRTTATIVADALAQLPASKVKTFDNVMAELAATGAEGVVQMADMLVPAADGKNATVEYALSGVVAYVSAAGREGLKAEVRKGLAEALDKCTDNPNKAFLMTQLALCAEAEDAPVFVKYIDDEYLGDWAVKGLVSTPGTDAVILEMMKNETAPRAALAYAASKKGLAEAEPILLAWIGGADTKTAAAIYNALGICGSAASLKALGTAAKAVNYEWEDTDATASYLVLLNNVAAEGNAAAVAAAKALLKATDKSNVRTGALEAIFAAEGKKAMPILLAALNDNDRKYRVAALKLSEPFADEELYAAVSKIVTAKGDKPVKVDIVNWLGALHAESQIDAVVASMNAADDALASAAIKAAGRIGGPKALEALISQLGGERSAEAEAALLAFNGKVNEGILAALDGEPAVQAAALKIASKRRMAAAADKVFALLGSKDEAVSAAAYDALAGVTTVKDFDRLSDLAEKASGDNVAKLQKALKNSVVSLEPAKQYETAAARLNRSSKKALYYPVLAQAGDSRSIAELRKGYVEGDRQAAFASLLAVDNTEMIPVLYDIAVKDKANADAALNRYTDMVVKSGNTPVRKYQLYRKALELKPAVNVQNKLVKALSATNTYQALLLADSYIDNKETAAAAASTVKSIAAKNSSDLGGASVRKALERAMAEYKRQSQSNADAGYAVDEINGLLAKLPAADYVPVLAGMKGWTAVAMNPEAKAAMKAKKAAQAEAVAAAAAEKLWSAAGSGLKYAGGEASTLGSDKDYENFELWFEWKGRGALGVRSIPRIDLGGAKSGALSGNEKGKNAPAEVADNEAGEWNTTYVKVLNDRVTVSVNGVVTADNVILENTCNREIPAYVEGKILLIGEGEPLEFREMYLRELPSTPRFELSPEEAAEGFEVLFDGTSMHKWTGNTTDYIPVDGTIFVSAQYGNGGNLYTVKEYSDFVYRFEFCFVREGVNNGVGIRTPMGVDAAYHGMEIQILDHDAPIYKNLRVYQQHGSVYGIIPAKRVKFPALGEWNTEEIRAVGDRITVTVNGEVILDGDIREACQGHNVAENGEKTNPYTVDHKNHPGLFNKSGHIGFLGHGSGVKFRNIRIKDLSVEAPAAGKKAKKNK